MRVADLLGSSAFGLAQLAFAKLGEATRDLPEARLAIEALRALLPVVDEALPEDVARDLRATVANLQLAYAEAAAQPGAGPEPPLEPDA